MKPIILSILFLFCIFFERTEAATDNKLHSKFEIGAIRKSDSIFAKTSNMLKADSLYLIDVHNRQDSIKGFKPSENYSLIKLHWYYNDRLSDDSFLLPGFTCFTRLIGDTIEITGTYMEMGMLIGWKQQTGFEIKISRQNFTTSYFDYWALDKRYYKSTIDKEQNYIEVGAKKQRLQLLEQPVFKVGEMLKGHLTFTTNDYFLNGRDGFVKANVSCDIYFKTRIVESNILGGVRCWQHVVQKIMHNHDDSFPVNQMKFNYIPNSNSLEAIWKYDENGIDLFDVFKNKVVYKVPLPINTSNTPKQYYVFDGNKFIYLFPIYSRFSKSDNVIIYNKQTRNNIPISNSRFKNVASIKFPPVFRFPNDEVYHKKIKPEFQIDSVNIIRLDLAKDTFLLFKRKAIRDDGNYYNTLANTPFHWKVDSTINATILYRNNNKFLQLKQGDNFFYADSEICIYNNYHTDKFYVLDSFGNILDSIRLQNIHIVNQQKIIVARKGTEIIFRMDYNISNPDQNDSRLIHRDDFLMYNLKTRKSKFANFNRVNYKEE